MIMLMPPFRHFLRAHDELPAFHAGYLVVSFLIAALLNLGVFALLIVTHMSFDYVKYSEKYGSRSGRVWKGIISESIIDMTLLLVGLVFAVYLHHGTEFAAASGLLRSGATILRGFGLAIPKFEVLHHVLGAFLRPQKHMDVFESRTSMLWTKAMKLHGLIALACLLLLAVAPSLLHLDGATIAEIIERQMIPWIF